MCDAERNVDAFVDQVYRPVDKMEPHRYSWIFVHEGVKDRPQDIFAGDDRRSNGQRSARGRPFAGRNDVSLLKIDQNAAARGGVTLTGLAQFERPRRAMKKLGADMGLEEGDRTAHGSRRSAQASARSSETPLIDGRHKDLH